MEASGASVFQQLLALRLLSDFSVYMTTLALARGGREGRGRGGCSREAKWETCSDKKRREKAKNKEVELTKKI